MKKLFILIVVLFMLLSGSFAQTPVSGDQSGVWAISGSPYEVSGEITIQSGESLTIESGVEVNFLGHYKFTVNGTLLAIGTLTDTILFTTDNPGTGWHGIRLTESQTGSVFQFCRFEFGKTSGSNFPDQHGGAVMMNNSDAIIKNCLFYHNEATADDNGMGGAIYGINTTSGTQIMECLFIENHTYGEGGAIKFTGDNGANIESCRFIDNTVLYGGGAICLYGCYDTQIVKSLFFENSTTYSAGGAVFIEGYSENVRFVNCTMYNNQASGGDGGGVEIAFSDASFTNCIIYNNNGAYSDNIYLDFGYAEVNYCNTPFPEGATGGDNINTNAQFVDAVSGDFHLLPDSPCVDAGIDSLTITTAYNEVITVIDLDSSEYIGLAPDMGCFEYDPGTGIEDVQSGSFTVFPNPTTGRVHFNFNDDIESITVSCPTGKVLIFLKDISRTGSLDLSDFKTGLYFVTGQTGKSVYTVKVFKE